MTPRAAVFDCNVFLQAMLSARGAAHECWQKVRRGEVKLFIASAIVREIQRLPEHRELRRISRLTPERINRFLAEVLSVATVADDPPTVFTYERDPEDAIYVNLAIASGAMLVVSRDADLLDLMSEALGEIDEKNPFALMIDEADTLACG